MILSKQKPYEKVLESIGNARNLFIVGCSGCPIGCQSGGEKEVINFKEKLTGEKKNVKGWIMIDFLCNKALVGSRLRRRLNELQGTEKILVFSCGIGVQAVANMIDIPVVPVLDTISAGGLQGLWPSTERCQACGDCVLDRTAGICPFTTCAKRLLNGPCGGSHSGKCEVEKDRDCGWYMIFSRAKELGILDRLKEPIPPRDHRKRDLPPELRGTTLSALEFSNERRAQ